MSTKQVIIFVNESEKERRDKAEASVSRIIATYSGSITAEVNEAQAEQLKKEGFHIEPLPDISKIKLRSVEFDPKTEAPIVPKMMEFPLTETTPTEENYWIIQFIGPVKLEWIDAIRDLGGKVGDYVPDNAFLVQMTLGVKEQVSQLKFVRWVGPYHPAYKISPLLIGVRGKIAPAAFRNIRIADEALKPTPIGNLRVLLHKADDANAVKQEVENLGGTVISIEKNVLRVSIDATKIEALAGISKVQWIEPYVVPKLFNDVAAEIIGVQSIWNDHDLDGDGQIVAVIDTGLDTGVNDNNMHDDFKGRIVSIYSWPIPEGLHQYLDNSSWNDGAADTDSGHGTHVAGSILGNGTRSNSRIRGVAFNAKLVFQAVEQFCKVKPDFQTKFPSGYRLVGIPDDLNTLFQQSYNDGARIFSNSWGGVKDSSGNPAFGQYTVESQLIDEFIWNHKDAVILFAAGNNGMDEDGDGIIDADSLAVQATAKNCITVGASENNRPHGSNPKPGLDDNYGNIKPVEFPAEPINSDHVSDNPDGMAAFSSRGPTADERIKPDVVAPGTNILSVRSSVTFNIGWGLLPNEDPNRPYYKYDGGTSMATPITAGATALIRQYLQKNGFSNPSAALVKAILIHGAVPMAGQYKPPYTPEVGPVPNNDEGWGRINLEKALFPANPLKLEFRDSEADALGSGDLKEYTFSVTNTTVPFRATLVWTDYPSTPAAGGLFNQLRLSITTPDGNTTQGGPDNNNVQQVIFNMSQMGTYTVRVAGINVPSATIPEVNKKQDFVLVVTGGL